MKIGICCDHHGVAIKEDLINYIGSLNFEVIDYGCHENIPTDYPDLAFNLGKNIGKEIDLGIAMCKTGIGMSICLNKVKGIRCAHIENINEAKLCKEHNHANAIAFSTELPIELIKQMIKIYLTTPFSNEIRHLKRVEKITKYEDGNYDI